MSVIGLWLARLLPLLGCAAHIAGAVIWHTQPEHTALGRGLVFAAWIGITLYTLVVHLQGDFIQRALNCKPWNPGDEMQRRAAHGAMTMGYLVLLFVGGAVLGMHLDDFVFSPVTEPQEAIAAGRRLFLEVATLVYLGVATPTVYLGWTLKPLTPEPGE